MNLFDRLSRSRPLFVAATVLALAGGAAAQSTWFVDASQPGGNGTSWANAFADLQSALAVVQPGQQIWVADGTYLPTLATNPLDPRSATFSLPGGVRIYGGFAGGEATLAERAGLFDNTILSGATGTASAFDNAYHVVTMDGDGQGQTRLDGFTIRDGYSLFDASVSRGAGVTVKGGAVLHVVLCTITGNDADQGGGLAVTNLGVLKLQACKVIGNGGDDIGGGVYVQTGTLHSFGTLWLNNFGLNAGGAAYVTSTNPGMVVFCNDIFTENTADEGGAIYVAGGQFIHGSVRCGNCTFADNFSNSGLSIFAKTGVAQPAVLTVQNSICWHSHPAAAPHIIGSGATVNVSYSNIEGGFAGSGNIDADPLFVNGFEPVSGSPCNDAGNNGLLVPDLLDLDRDGNTTEPVPVDYAGGPRLTDDPLAANVGAGTPPVDMGAFEL